MLEFLSHPYLTYGTYYLLGGVVFNFFYDMVVTKTEDENLRFNMMERISVGLVWPIFTMLFIYNFLKVIFGDNDK